MDQRPAIPNNRNSNTTERQGPVINLWTFLSCHAASLKANLIGDGPGDLSRGCYVSVTFLRDWKGQG